MAQQKKTAKKQKRAGSGCLTVIIILVLVTAIGWKLYDLQGQLQSAQAEKAEYEARVAQLQAENDRLTKDIAEGATSDKIQEIARNELGLVTPDEYVFYDTSN